MIGSEEGSMTILALFLFICMVLVGGIAVDIMIFENNRTRLQNLGDRAALAASDLDQTIPARDIVTSYFEKEGLGASLKDVQVTEGVNHRSVSVETEQFQKTLFMNFMDLTGVDQLRPHSFSAATELKQDIEISLVLDVSNSMNWASSAPGSTSKLNDLKAAGKRFIDTIYAGGNADHVTVSLIPYATHVSAGPVILEELGVTRQHDYSSCLSFTDADFATSEIRAGDVYAHTAHFDQWYSSEDPTLFVCRPEEDQRVRPLLSDPEVIKQHIDNLTANGNTSIEIGLKWGAAFLDPSARNLTRALIDEDEIDAMHDNRPYDWDRGNTQKYVVVLTDGVNTEQQEIAPAYANGASGVYRWRPIPGADFQFYSFRADEVGDENRNGIANEVRYWHPARTIPAAPGIARRSFSAGYTAQPFGAPGTTAAQPYDQAIAPVELDYADLWAEMSVRHFAYYYVRAESGSNSVYNQFLRDVWSPVNGPTKDARQLQLCDQLRDKGATIFTIGFEVTDHSANIMSQCASTPNYFIRVVGDDLEAAFDQIAASITKLRLTQ
ncbi:pilus assembly protein TadG-related protein [Oceaniglobus indicus]|uniref:pilus assembly protein TadG-related protein n=1 Tax=Oceaniglobus indicus TaxID=2047749 RepID=UPI00130418F5|nr:pilus assembly protein TadG-related protein [Oceaniglobus indicus]